MEGSAQIRLALDGIAGKWFGLGHFSGRDRGCEALAGCDDQVHELGLDSDVFGTEARKVVGYRCGDLFHERRQGVAAGLRRGCGGTHRHARLRGEAVAWPGCVRRDRLLLRSRDLHFGCAPGTGGDRAGLPERDPQELIASITTEPEVIVGHGWELSSLHFGRSLGAILPQHSSLRGTALSDATLVLAPGAVRSRHAAKLVLAALWSRLLSLRICFVRRRSPDPRPSADRGSLSDAPAVGDWESVGRRGRAGQETTGRTSLRGAWFKPRSGGRSEPGGASPRSPRWDKQIPCLVAHTGNGASVVRGLVSTRRGSEEWGTNAPFWLGSCATNLRFAGPFGSWPKEEITLTPTPTVARARSETSIGPRR